MHAEQHDHHCIMNVDYQPWRIQSIQDGRYMVVVSDSGRTRTADLSVLNWTKYCDAAAAWLTDECARLRAHEAVERDWREREEARIRREAREMARQMIAEARLFASGYGLIEDLEDEVVLVNLEFTDPEPILAVDCQTTHLERLAA
jgi:hypothetical protein